MNSIYSYLTHDQAVVVRGTGRNTTLFADITTHISTFDESTGHPGIA